MDRIANRIEMSEGSDAPGGPAAVVDDPDEIEQGRKRTRRIYVGFGLGIVLGFVVTAVHLAYSGYQILPLHLVWNLIWAPCLGLIMGINLGRGRRAGPWKWKRPQLRTRTLMVVVAYVALLLGMGVSTRRLGNSARQYPQRYVSSESLAEVFREQGRKSEAEAELRRANVEGLRSGKIPVGLLPGQRDFLRTLEVDPKVTPEYRD